MLVQTDARRRITLPPSAKIKPGDTVEVEVLEDGRIMLIPVEAVPKHQLWAWTVESKEAIRASLIDPRPSTIVTSAAEAEAVAKRWTDEG
jgi:endonuclease YncB( thermonuclease family)